LEISLGRIEAKKGSLFAFIAQDITERRQTEDALLREKDFSDAIINSLPGIFYVWDEQGHLVRRNKNHELVLGYSAEEFEHLGPLDLIATEDRDFIAQKLVEVYAGLESQGDAQLLTRSGEKLPYRLTGSSVHIENKTYLMGVGIDISQQKKAENEIRQRTAQLEALRQTSLEIVAELNLNSLLHSIVARAIRLLMGTSGGLYLYRSEQDALEWTIDVGALQIRGNLIRQGKGLAGRVWKTGQPLVIADYQHWEGQADFLENSTVAAVVGAPLRWRDKFLGVLVVTSPIAHSFSASDAELLSMFATQAAIALQNAHLFEESQHRAQELFVLNAISQLLTSTFDLDTVLKRTIDSVRVLLAAKAASVFLHEPASTTNPEPALVIAAAAGPGSEKLLGLRLPVTTGIVGWVMQEKQPVLVNQANQDPRFDPQIDALTQITTQSIIAAPLLVKNTVFGVIEALNRETGSFDPRDLELLSTVAGSAAIAIENAGLYQAEREQYRRLQQSQAQLVQAEKMTALGRLAATLAHEINNPLQAITSDLELILDFPLDKDEQLARLRVIRQEIDRLSEMTRSVLTFSRPSLAPRRIVAITDLIKQTLSLAHKKLQHSHIQVTTQWQVEPLVRAVPDQLVQVFLNVIINAIEAIYDHGQIHISVEVEDEQVIVRLSNDGPTIASEDLARIFEPFFTTKEGGTGLGLAVSHNIITQHGGTLSAENLPGARGVAFTVRLPLASHYQEAEVKT
jgi:PAS domain S-box-containing protein